MESSTVAAIRAMEKLGYVTRTQMSDNRKNVYVHLTAKGRALKAKLVAARAGGEPRRRAPPGGIGRRDDEARADRRDAEPQSIFAPVALTMVAYFSYAALLPCPYASGVEPTASMPSAVKRCTTSGCFTPSRFRRQPVDHFARRAGGARCRSRRRSRSPGCRIRRRSARRRLRRALERADGEHLHSSVLELPGDRRQRGVQQRHLPAEQSGHRLPRAFVRHMHDVDAEADFSASVARWWMLPMPEEP